MSGLKVTGRTRNGNNNKSNAEFQYLYNKEQYEKICKTNQQQVTDLDLTIFRYSPMVSKKN